jgi:hypothetical protein
MRQQCGGTLLLLLLLLLVLLGARWLLCRPWPVALLLLVLHPS